MKKYVIAIVIFITVLFALIYSIIPNTIVVSTIKYTAIKPAAISRCLHDKDKLESWFPGKFYNENNFRYSDEQYAITNKEYNTVDISITDKDQTYLSTINVIQVNPNTAAVQWKFEYATSNNPIKRIEQYQRAKTLKTNTSFILDSLKSFIENTKNLYGFNINFTTLTDTALVSIKTNTQTYPTITLIYSLVDELKKYIAQNNAIQYNSPMLNITQQIDSSYEIMVGVPTNILLNGTSRILPKRMIMLKNKTITTEVKGDNNQIKKGLQAINMFMDDNGLSSPVIPFQLLITDRRQNQDSTKWITKIFVPII